jgi:shikimate kinase
MRGVGVGHGAVTIVNALATGIGCAAGIRLRTAVELELDRADAFRMEMPAALDTRSMRQLVAAALTEFAGSSAYAARLTVSSEIPPSKGLKSSSALNVAVARAIGGAMDRPVPPLAAAEFASRFESSTGRSATGAFDDALAGAAGGIALTENAPLHVVRHDPVAADWRVVLWAPEGSHGPSVEWLEAFRDAATEGDEAVRAAKDGDYPRAMRRNTALVERIRGYDYASLHDALRSAGALASGVSGMGPAVAAIVRHDLAPAVLAEFPSTLGTRQLLEFLPMASERRTVAR